MFRMDILFEILEIVNCPVIVAIIALGPEKLPDTMVQIAKIFKN